MTKNSPISYPHKAHLTPLLPAATVTTHLVSPASPCLAILSPFSLHSQPQGLCPGAASSGLECVTPLSHVVIYLFCPFKVPPKMSQVRGAGHPAPLYTHTPLQLPTLVTEHPRAQATQTPAHTVPSTPGQDHGLHTSETVQWVTRTLSPTQ